MSAYDKIARVYDPWSRSVVEDVPFYVDEAVKSGGPILELGVGTGRVAVPIAAAGIGVVGVDLSAGMLEVAAEAAALAGVELDLRHGDMRDPPVDEAETFPLVICPFRSLLHMETDDDRRQALRAASRGLSPEDGRFVFDVFTPSAEDIRTRTVSSSASLASGSATGTKRRARLILRVRSMEPSRRCRSRGCRSRVADAPARGGLRGRGAVRLVRPLAGAAARTCGLDLPAAGRPAEPRAARFAWTRLLVTDCYAAPGARELIQGDRTGCGDVQRLGTPGSGLVASTRHAEPQDRFLRAPRRAGRRRGRTGRRRPGRRRTARHERHARVACNRLLLAPHAPSGRARSSRRWLAALFGDADGAGVRQGDRRAERVWPCDHQRADVAWDRRAPSASVASRSRPGRARSGPAAPRRRHAADAGACDLREQLRSTSSRPAAVDWLGGRGSHRILALDEEEPSFRASLSCSFRTSFSARCRDERIIGPSRARRRGTNTATRLGSPAGNRSTSSEAVVVWRAGLS